MNFLKANFFCCLVFVFSYFKGEAQENKKILVDTIKHNLIYDSSIIHIEDQTKDKQYWESLLSTNDDIFKVLLQETKAKKITAYITNIDKSSKASSDYEIRIHIIDTKISSPKYLRCCLKLNSGNLKKLSLYNIYACGYEI